MLPLILADQIRNGIEDFLRTSFPMPAGRFATLVEDFISTRAAIKGPYLSLSLPFRTVERDDQGKPRHAWFPEILTEDKHFLPYIHQELSFQRLSPADGSPPRSTIVATGTGSGKTECFLLPILEHCRRQRALGKKGIKAIFIYPMNALATDQAGRLAKIVAQTPALAGLRAGLYIGGQKPGQGAVDMTDREVITNRESMRAAPPDMLLTNYKMLDFLLIRPDDATLWRYNDPETLAYLVVDELHTFDGAQGTDLACLIRRLKARLGTPPDGLCCVGTSATLGNDAQGTEALLHYAGDIFGTDMRADAIIGEYRLSAAEFLGENETPCQNFPPVKETDQLRLEAFATVQDWLAAQYRIWLQAEPPADMRDLETRKQLGCLLKACPWFQKLIRLLNTETAPAQALAQQLFARIDDEEERQLLLHSLCSLVSMALDATGSPLLHLVRTQLWVREMARMVASVHQKPELTFHSDITEHKDTAFLPLVSCRECGATGWLSVTDVQDSQFFVDLDGIYRAFFATSSTTAPAYSIFFPDRTRADALNNTGSECVICGACHALRRRASDTGCCPACHAEQCIPVFRHVSTDGQDCPFCKAHKPWLVLGSRAASLTSAVISILFGSRANDDKKLITFSDNVQDAAHRAGFFGARTFALTLRSAMQQCLDALDEEPLLADFSVIFAQWWQERLRDKARKLFPGDEDAVQRRADAAYAACFLHPSMEWFSQWQQLCKDGVLAPDSTLLDSVNKRLQWEMAANHTFNAGIGRTPEKVGASIAHVPTAQLQAAAKDLRLTLQNQVERLRHCGLRQCCTFVAGVVCHMRRNGAAFVYGDAVEQVLLRHGGNAFAIGQRIFPYMPAFGPRHKTPLFVSENPKGHFESVVKNATWFLRWAQKNFPDLVGLDIQILQQVYALLFQTLESSGLLEARDVNGKPVRGLARKALRLTNEVCLLQCSQCRHILPIAREELPLWHDAPCVRLCGGVYAALPDQPHFYANLYRHGVVERLFTEEHTGLRPEKDRETVEQSFKHTGQERQPWDCNLLSCTPTLEMGIDIGELSATIQCSVPPTQANYLQRIGRAGRKNGNACTITIAGTSAHDLYFYTNPLLMMQGTVASPGVFLNASAVLERQLTAFCMDCWVANGARPGDMPDKLGKALSAVERRRHAQNDAQCRAAESGFPYNFLRFIDLHATALLERFVAMFGTSLQEETRSHLQDFLLGVPDDGAERYPLRAKILHRLGRTLDERESLRKRIKKARDKAKALAASPVQDENTRETVEHLRREAEGLTALVGNIQDRQTLQFFTDEGLMPNYAFPEQGVTLHSIIYNKKTPSKDMPGLGNDEVSVYEYVRAAASALTDFAPGNAFYAGKRKVVINQIDKETSTIEDWRLCPSCSFAEPHKAASPRTCCPRCGSTLFADSGQLRQMLKMSQVFATASDRDSRLNDDSDQREPVFFLRQYLVDYAPEDVEQAWKLDTEATVFGYAYVRKAHFREINFGEPDTTPGILVAGVQRHSRGFRICKRCGSVLGAKPDIQKHAWGCPCRTSGAREHAWDCVYLYRNFTSEAVKLLLPFTGDSFTQGVESFTAAFALGMKRQFGGALGHLQTLLHSEPDPADANVRKQYLIIYDTVPGGTGYLKQLMRDDALFAIFRKALRHMERCACADTPRHDGCYQCLLAYGNSRFADRISKKDAVDALRLLLQHAHTLTKTTSLQEVTAGSLYESELEKRFIEALRRSSSPQRPIRLRRQIDNNGREGFFLEIGEARWTIEQQVELDQRQGILVPSRADFVFRPARSSMNTKPVVVFTDGYSYHRDRLGMDSAQRSALVLSGKYWVWSLCWEDVNALFGGKSQENALDLVEPAWKDAYDDILRGNHLSAADRLRQKDSFTLLLEYLSSPDQEKFRNLARSYVTMAALGKIDAALKASVAQLSPAAL
ncbi:MAG: DEAD/DEAH box helicase, partial [Desulfovibrio sp.]|nr:DEAD/DEAH box helicase [Desulfovibrio sp.]